MKHGHKNHVWIKAARTEAWAKQGCKCAYCRSKLKRCEVTADHVQPKARGGTDAKNIAAACRFCNKAKGRISPKRFKRMITGGLKAPNVYINHVRVVRALNRQTEIACKRILASVGVCS